MNKSDIITHKRKFKRSQGQVAPSPYVLILIKKGASSILQVSKWLQHLENPDYLQCTGTLTDM